MARAACRGLEVTLPAAVDIEEGGAHPLCARQFPGAVRSRRQACRADTGWETAAETALALLGEAVKAGAGESLGARWVAVDGGYSSRPFVEGVRALDLHTVGRLRRDAVLRSPYTGPHERRPGRKRQFDGCFDLSRMARTTPKDAKVDLYHAVLHAKAWQCRQRVVYVLPRGADPETKEGMLLDGTDTELEPERIFRFYGARFQIEFAFRDARQHLGLNHGQARSQARQHFHFNLVFATLFWARLQARLRAERPLGPFSLRDPRGTISRRKYTNEVLPGRPQAETPPIPRAAAAASRRNASGCAHLLPKWGRPAPEYDSWTGTAHRIRPQNVSKP